MFFLYRMFICRCVKKCGQDLALAKSIAMQLQTNLSSSEWYQRNNYTPAAEMLQAIQTNQQLFQQFAHAMNFPTAEDVAQNEARPDDSFVKRFINPILFMATLDREVDWVEKTRTKTITPDLVPDVMTPYLFYLFPAYFIAQMTNPFTTIPPLTFTQMNTDAANVLGYVPF